MNDTIYSPRIDGIPCRALDTSAARHAVKRGFNPFIALINSYAVAKNMRLPYLKVFFSLMGRGYKSMKQLAHMAMAFESFQIATKKGDMKTGVLPVGQVMGLLQDEPTVVQLMERMFQEAIETQKRLTEILS